MSIPAELRPADGRFGSGPSKVRPEAVTALEARTLDYLGTSHRRTGVRSVVGRLRAAMAELFGLGDGWEVVLGNGGSTGFWDAAAFSLIERRSQHLAFGEFSEKFSAVTAAAPHLDDPMVITAPYGSHPVPEPADVDVYALTHNETSTGVCMPLGQPQLTEARSGTQPGLALVDATSAAGGMTWDPTDVDCYYFAPQKAFAADGGLFIALCAPSAIERIERIDAAGRYKPATLDLAIAARNSRQDQTYNTPALATILLTLETAEWMLDGGGLGLGRRAFGSFQRRHLPLGGSARLRLAVRGRSPDALPRRVHHRLRGRQRRRHRSGAASQRHRGHRGLPQAGPQPTPHRRLPCDRADRRRSPHRLHRLHRRAALAPLPASQPRFRP